MSDIGGRLVTITNESPTAVEIPTYLSYNKIVVPGKVGGTNGSVTVEINDVNILPEFRQLSFLTTYIAGLDGVSISSVDLPDVSSGELQVYVVDSSGDAVVGATITATPLVGEATVLTSEDGVNVLTLSNNTYSLKVEKETYTTKELSSIVVAGEITNIYVTLVPAGVLGVLQVYVTDNAGDVAGATITATPSVGEATVLTSVVGVNSLTLANGTYTLSVAKEAYVTEQLTSIVVANNTTKIYVNLIHVPPTTGSIIFEVIDGDAAIKTPIEGVLISAAGAAYEGLFDETSLTDASGLLTVVGIPLDPTPIPITLAKIGFDSRVINVAVTLGENSVYVFTSLVSTEP